MGRTPSGNDEQSEDVQTLQRTRRTSSPSQQRKNVGEPKQVSANYYGDDYPGIPKIRRASRFRDEQQPHPLRPGKIPINERPAEEDERETHFTRQVQRPRSQIRGVQPRRPTVHAPSNSQPPYRQGQPGLHGTYARRGRHEKARQAPSLLTIWQDFSHNRPLLVIVAIALAALIVLPLFVNSFNTTSTAPGTLPGVSQSGGQQTIGQPPANSHELVITPSDSDHPAPPVFAKSAYLLDADTGATLYAHNPFLHLPIMSTTKLMTATLAIEHGNLDQNVTINDAIANDISQLSADSSVMGIKRGETYTLRELLYGLLLVSGNDAAIAIADTIGGNLPNFVSMMNQRASQLGMQDTHYMNPHGLLAPDHYSSAHDLAVLGRYSLSLPQLHQISGTEKYDIPQTANHPEHSLINGNEFLWWYPGVDGGKPGWDGAYNHVQVISCVRNGHHLIGVTIYTKDWWTDMRDLLNWGFNTFSWISPHDVDLQHPIPYDNLWNYFADDRKDITIPTADQGRYYIYTGYSISGPVLSYFDQNGGLGKFGYPTGLLTATGATTISQQFEQATIQCDTASQQCSAT